MARWEHHQTPTIPDWFWKAVDTPFQQGRVEIEDCDVVYQTWGESSQPGVLLIHGMNAHKSWWDFIAPSLLPDYYVVAMDLTGMGDSDFRYEYDSTTYSLEIEGVRESAGMSADSIMVGHSFGGRMAIKSLGLKPDLFKALVLVDSGLRHPDEPEPDYPSLGGGRDKIYPSKESAESRFRLFPPQPCENEYLLKYIAQKSLVYVDGGWGWKFDAELPLVMKNVELDEADLQALDLPVGVIYGADSISFTAQTLEHMRALISNLKVTERIENAQHHVFLDQPIAFSDALRRVLGELRD